MKHLLRISAVLGLLFIAVPAKAQVSIGGGISFGGRFFQGYWGTPRGGVVRHNHRWDRDTRRRDFNRR